MKKNKEWFQNQVEDTRLEKIENAVIQELEVPLKMILIELYDRINSGAYGVIIGDDVSGRIPARILGGVVKGIYERNHRAAPEVRFIAGSTWLSDEEKKREKIDAMADVVKKAMKSAKDKGLLGDRVLFVTETIVEGRTVLAFAKACEKAGFHFDIATATYRNKRIADQALANIGDPNIRIAYGHDKGIPRIFYNQAVSGLEKDPDNLHARRLPKGKFDNKVFISARKDVNTLIKDLSRYWNDLPSERKRIKDVYARLVAIRDDLFPDYKKALVVIGSDGHADLYRALKEHGKVEILKEFSSLYERYRNDPAFRVLIRQKSKEEQDILVLLQRAAEKGRPLSEAQSRFLQDLLIK